MAVRKHPRNKEKSVKVPGMMTRFSWSRLRKRLSGTGTACEWKKLKQGGTGCSLPAQQSTGCVSECCCLTSGVCGDVVIPSALRGRTPALPSALLRCLPAADPSEEGEKQAAAVEAGRDGFCLGDDQALICCSSLPDLRKAISVFLKLSNFWPCSISTRTDLRHL